MRRIGNWLVSAAVLGGCSTSTGTTVVNDSTTTPPAVTRARPPTTTDPADATTTTVARTTAPTDESAPTTSTAPTSLAPSTLAPVPLASTTLAPLEPIVLGADGLGGAGRIGEPVGVVVDAISVRLGTPTSDESMQFASEPTPSGWFTTPDEEYGFSAPVARTVCWPRELCVVFGGRDATALTLRGWRYAVPDVGEIGTLTTASGLTVGRRWSEFAAEITAPPGGCYSIGYGRTTGGIGVELRGGMWSQFGEDGSYEELRPDPDEVIISELSVGDHVVSLYADC